MTCFSITEQGTHKKFTHTSSICRQSNKSNSNAQLHPLASREHTHFFIHAPHTAALPPKGNVSENAQMLIMFHLLVMVSEPALKIVPFEMLPPSNPTLAPAKVFFMLNGCPSMKISSDLVDKTGFWNWVKFLDLMVLYWKFWRRPMLPCPLRSFCLSCLSFSLFSSSCSFSSVDCLFKKFLILSKIPNGLSSVCAVLGVISSSFFWYGFLRPSGFFKGSL